jgi:hypothetical protein
MIRTLAWFSCGAASAVATKLTAEAEPVYCETGAEHPDNERFLADCEQWFGRKVTRLKSDKYADTWDVWTKRRYLAGVQGALCTVELKAAPRIAFQRPDDIHILGYTADAADVTRANRLRETYPEQASRRRAPPIGRWCAASSRLSSTAWRDCRGTLGSGSARRPAASANAYSSMRSRSTSRSQIPFSRRATFSATSPSRI